MYIQYTVHGAEKYSAKKQQFIDVVSSRLRFRIVLFCCFCRMKRENRREKIQSKKQSETKKNVRSTGHRNDVTNLKSMKEISRALRPAPPQNQSPDVTLRTRNGS